MVILLLLVTVISPVLGLENGLARTPPMGWLTWERFRCNTDCANDPNNCIGEKLIKDMADRIAEDGYNDAGYEYVIIDDCWPDHQRGPDGRLRPDPVRFPNGMKALADYVHSKGLKFGLYEDFGVMTCAKYPGSLYYLQLDTQTFADWGVDYMKFDVCYNPGFAYGYPPMAFYLNMTGRPIVLSCEYPLAQQNPNYTEVAQTCNTARNHHDIGDSWDALLSTIEFYGDNKGNFSGAAGPGFFNDPDMLLVGNFGLSYEQERTNMGMWAMMASPLLMSTDLRNIRPESKALLQNKNVLAINQDPLAKQGNRINKSDIIEIWTKPLAGGACAFALVNVGGKGRPQNTTFKVSDLGLHNPVGYKLTEVFDGKDLGHYKPKDTFWTMVNPTGIFLAKASPVSDKDNMKYVRINRQYEKQLRYSMKN